MQSCRFRSALASAVITALFAQRASAIVSSDGGDEAPLTGTNINQFVGADPFYSNGYTGSGVVIANIEAGLVWNGHEALDEGQVAQYFADPSISGQADWTTTWTDAHATEVGQILVGQGTSAYQIGIASGATLWSGAIATNWVDPGNQSYTTNFATTNTAFTTPYYDALVAGVKSAGTADVINSSYTIAGGNDGNSYYAQTIDALTFASGKLVVFASGNGGPATNSIGGPAAAFNALVVGATSSDTSNYNSVGTFSSVSPSAVYNPVLGADDPAVFRAAVDLVAPGDNLTVAAYGGTTGGNQFGGFSYPGANYYNSEEQGTSFAAPTVAGGAALLVQVGKAQFAGNANAIDARVIKAVLMNSATQLAGYNNGQTNIGGVVTTTQALDYTQGAGQLNLFNAYSQYTLGTQGVAGGVGGTVQPTGWDLGTLQAKTTNTYTIGTSLPGGSSFTITLDWFAHDYVNIATGTAGYGAFDNLDLIVLKEVDGTLVPVAQSISKYSSVEHLSFNLPSTGTYAFDVVDAGFNWNGINGITDTSTQYGVAWTNNVPEPTPAVVLGLCLAIMTLQRRPRRLLAAGT